MQLFYSPNSPYARKCRALVIEKGLEAQVRFIQADAWANPPELLAANPLARIPALVGEGGLHVSESQIICEYLDGLPSASPAFFPADRMERFNVLALTGLSEGIMDAAVDIVIQRRQKDSQPSPALIQRREQAILRGVEAAATHALPGDAILNIGTLSLACALAYVHFRLPHLQWEHSFPALDTWLAHALKRPAFERTQPEA